MLNCASGSLLFLQSPQLRRPRQAPHAPAESRGYFQVRTNGGLNQMRAGICDMVDVARIINATLVIPELDQRSFWKDSSNFSNVFDEDHFINALANDVKIVRNLPKELASGPRELKLFRSWGGMDYYQDEIASLWELYKAIRASKADARLVNNNLPLDIQKLRCRACYEALRFTPEIEAMGKLLVDRMRSFGPYIALHLRFEKDMLAFSGCTQDLTPSEADELRMIRENTKTWRNKEINPIEQRSRGYCPLTPRETGIFLSALGYPPNTPIYIAAGNIYGDSRMADLLSRFPILKSKHWHKLRSLNLLPIMRLKWLRLTTLFQLKVMYLYLHTLDTWRLQLKVTVPFLDTGKQYLLIEKPLFRCLTNLSRELLRKAKPYQIQLFKCTGNGKAPHGREEVPLQDLGGRISFVQKNHFTRTPYQIVRVEKNSQCKEVANHLIYFKMTKWVL